MASRKTYFISDLHLTEDRPDITNAFKLFLEKHMTDDVDALYILVTSNTTKTKVRVALTRIHFLQLHGWLLLKVGQRTLTRW